MKQLESLTSEELRDKYNTLEAVEEDLDEDSKDLADIIYLKKEKIMDILWSRKVDTD